jgi:hypothetical protein
VIAFEFLPWFREDGTEAIQLPLEANHSDQVRVEYIGEVCDREESVLLCDAIALPITAASAGT